MYINLSFFFIIQVFRTLHVRRVVVGFNGNSDQSWGCTPGPTDTPHANPRSTHGSTSIFRSSRPPPIVRYLLHLNFEPWFPKKVHFDFTMVHAPWPCILIYHILYILFTESKFIQVILLYERREERGREGKQQKYMSDP